jgi:hypothetical protein
LSKRLAFLQIVWGDLEVSARRTCRVLMEGWTLGQVIPALGEHVRRQQQQAQQVFTQLLQAGIASGEFRADVPIPLYAQMLTALLQGLMVEWHLHPGTVHWQQVAEETVCSLRRSGDVAMRRTM